MLSIRFDKLFHHPQAILVVLAALALTAISLVGDSGDFAISVLSMLAVASILLDGQNKVGPPTKRNWMALAIYALIALAAAGGIYTLLSSINCARALPFLFLLGYWLWHSGRDGIAGHWKALLLLVLLAIPDRTLMSPLIAPFLLASGLPELTHATAHFATWLCNLMGISATLEGLSIHLDHAIVTVWEGCDGGRNMDFLVCLSLMLILAFNIRWQRWALAILTGLAIAFAINGVRVTLLAYLANIDAAQVFDYWHEGDGSKIFNLTAIALFAVFGYFQLPNNKKPDKTPTDPKPLSQPEAQTQSR